MKKAMANVIVFFIIELQKNPLRAALYRFGGVILLID